jgi:hypothetical protein
MSEHVCPQCSKSTYDDNALLCHFCGESLGRRSSGILGRITAVQWSVAAVVLVAFVILAVI